MLIFFLNFCLFYFIPFFTHLSLGPGDPDSVPSSVPVDISVIYISVSGPLFSHCCYSVAKSWTAACQASLSFTISRSLLKLMSIESVMSSNHLILCHPFSSCSQSFPASGSFPMSQFFISGGQSIGPSASASVLPMNIQD